MRMSFLVLAALACMGLGGCAFTIPTTAYIPQNVVRYEHKNSVDTGVFTYEPEIKGLVGASQLQVNGSQDLYLSSSVSEIVKRATALELEKTGVLISDKSDVVISGDVLEISADSIGITITWDYVVRYKILQKKDQRLLLSKEFKIPTKRTGKGFQLSDLAFVVYDLIVTGYDMFIRDPEVRKLLDVPPLYIDELKSELGSGQLP